MGMEEPSPEAAAVNAAALAALKARPGYAAALDYAMRQGVRLYEADPVRRLMMSDRARFVFTSGALHLHFNAGPDSARAGLTPGRLREAFAEAGLGGPNRAAAVIALMRWGGFLETAPAGPDRRRRLLIPTTRLVETFRERLRGQLEALALADPAYADGPTLIDDHDFYRALLALQYRGFTSGFRLIGLAPEAAPFLERSCGIPLLFLLSLPEGAGLSVSAMARRFGVSRAHVLLTLADAERQGLIRRGADGPADRIMQPALRDLVERFVGSAFLFNAACVRAARP